LLLLLESGVCCICRWHGWHDLCCCCSNMQISYGSRRVPNTVTTVFKGRPRRCHGSPLLAQDSQKHDPDRKRHGRLVTTM
jgi:hypothetical protein